MSCNLNSRADIKDSACFPSHIIALCNHDTGNHWMRQPAYVKTSITWDWKNPNVLVGLRCSVCFVLGKRDIASNCHFTL